MIESAGSKYIMRNDACALSDDWLFRNITISVNTFEWLQFRSIIGALYRLLLHNQTNLPFIIVSFMKRHCWLLLLHGRIFQFWMHFNRHSRFWACLDGCNGTSHSPADSVSTSNLVCIKEVAIRTTSSHMINIARIIYYTYIYIRCIRYKNAFNKHF